MPNPNLPINYKKNTYIGARYVPKFSDTPGSEWDNSIQYEPLTIVLYQGNSYTSKTFVPVGVDITNPIYWAQTGNYNAQVNSYVEIVNKLSNEFNQLNNIFVRPDDYPGENDSEKFNAMLQDNSAPCTFILNREYNLTAPIIINNKTDVTNQFYTFIGLGGSIIVNADGVIRGTETVSNGGVYWINVNFKSIGNLTIFGGVGNSLIRMFFEGCVFTSLKSVFDNDYLQSINFNNCIFRKITLAVNTEQLYNVTFNQCLVEENSNLIHVTNKAANHLVIVNSCLEGSSSEEMISTVNTSSLIVKNNYFESNNICLSLNGRCDKLCIEDNICLAAISSFININMNFEHSGFIKNNTVTSSSGSAGTLIITNGETPITPWQLFIDTNLGNVTDSTGHLMVNKMKAPANLNAAIGNVQLWVNGEYENSPAPNIQGSLFVTSNFLQMTQTIITNNNRMYTRKGNYGGTYGPWYEIALTLVNT